MVESQVRLYRDALCTPWGFRLQGGKDFKAPLKVQRVFVGSPAEGDLQRGDILLAIDNYDATQMLHKEAMDVIKQAGGALSLRIRRSAGVRHPPPTAAHVPKPSLPPALQYRSRPTEKVTSPTQPPPMSGFQGYGHDYSPASNAYPARQAQPKPMLDRLQMTLNHATSPPHAFNGEGQDEEEYQQASVSDLKRVFNPPKRQPDKRPAAVKQLKNQYNQISRTATTQKPTPKPTVQHLSDDRPYTYTAKPIWQKPKSEPSTYSLPEPGWTPKPTGAGGGVWSPVKAPQAATFTPQVPQAAPPPRPINARSVVEPQHTQPTKPAWMGSLKSSGGPKPWEMKEAEILAGPEASAAPQAIAHAQQNVQPHQPRVQNVHYGPGASAPQYSQHDGGPEHDSSSAQVKHLQYNSPLGLYSKQNVNAALSGQTTGKPGQGTMQVSGGGPPKTFDPQRSDVLKMLQEEELGRKGGRAAQVSARYQEPTAQGEMNYQGYVDQTKKSPAMGRLEQHVADVNLGTSDF